MLHELNVVRNDEEAGHYIAQQKFGEVRNRNKNTDPP